MRFMVLVASVMVVLHTASAPVTAQVEEPAAGFALWVRMPVGFIQNAVASAGAPQFVIGSRRERFGLGVALGFTILRATDEQVFDGQLQNENKLTATLFQVGPSGWLDIWRSADGRARGNIAASVSVGRLSLSDKERFRLDGGFDESETKSSGTLVGFHVALGGDHFLHPHFSLGLEAGFQGNFALGLEQEGTGGDSVGLWANGLYGAVRTMIVF